MKNRCKLMYVVESFATGVYSIVKDLAGNLPADKFEIILVHSLRPDTPTEYKQDFPHKHVKLIHVPMDSVLNYMLSIPKLIKIIKIERPDIIHLHSSRAGFLGRLSGKLAGNGVMFYSPHGFSFLRSDVGRLRQNLFFRLEQMASLLGGVVVASSEGEFQQAKKYSSQVVKIENFVDIATINKIASQVESEATNSPLIGTVGRITAARNPKMFTQLAQSLPNIRFTWVGYALDEEEKPRTPNITITGFLSHDEAISELAKLDVYVQTSLWEGMPIAVLEAMALGKPVVATDIIGNRDLITHGKTGFLAQNSEDFVRLLRMLIDDEDLRLRIGDAATKYVRQHHDMDLAIKRYSELYLLAGP